MPRSKLQQHNAPVSRLIEEIAHLRDLDSDGLRKRWRSVFRKQPADHLHPNLMMAVLAYRIQADTFGDLDAMTVQLLRKIGSGHAEVEPVREAYAHQRTALRPGTILAREWNGRLQHVTVTHHGFVWEGKNFRSLSAIAHAITGTKWNGHRFFGLRDKILPKLQKRS